MTVMGKLCDIEEGAYGPGFGFIYLILLSFPSK